MSDTPAAQNVRLTLQEPGGTPYDMQGDFGVLLVRQDPTGPFTLVAGSAHKLSDEDFGEVLGQALLVFVKAAAAHPGVPEKVRQVAKLISVDLEVVEQTRSPLAPASTPDSTETPTPAPQVSCQVRCDGLLGPPPPIEGDFVVACARQGTHGPRFSVIRAPASNLNDEECGRAFAGAWVALTHALVDDAIVAPHVRKWAGSILEEFARSARQLERASHLN